MRYATTRHAAIVAVATALMLALPAPAALENGVADLPGTTWVAKGRTITTASARGESARSSGKSGSMMIDLFEGGIVEIDSEKFGTITGTYAPVAGSARKAQGALDIESLGAAIDDFERRTERATRRQVGLRVSLDVTVKSTSLTMKLNRSREKMRVKAKLRFSGRVSARGQSARLRGAFRFRLTAAQTTD